MKRKYYVEDTFRKKVLMADSEIEAAQLFLKAVLAGYIHPKDVRVNTDWAENLGWEKHLFFGGEVFVGQQGFVEDMLLLGETLNDESYSAEQRALFSTAMMLIQIGHPEIAKEINHNNRMERVMKEDFDIELPPPTEETPPVYMIFDEHKSRSI